MLVLIRLSVRTLVAAALTATLTGAAQAQVVLPRVNPGVPVVPVNPQPQAQPKFNTLPQPQLRPVQPNIQGQQTPIRVMPQVNSYPGLPSFWRNQPAYPSAWASPALTNPSWPPMIVPTQINPFLPFNNPLINNNLFLPFNNPFAVNPFAVNPFATGPLMSATFPTPIQPAVPPTTVPLVRQPGIMMFRGPDLQVNPWSGTVVRPLTGTATLADGTTYLRLPNTSSLGGGNGKSDLYFDPQSGTFFNPSSGVISRGNGTYIPYVW